MFNDCKKLSSLPDLSKWKLNNLERIENMFKGCDSFKERPIIFNFITNNSNNISSNEKSSNDKEKSKKKKKCNIF